MLFLPVSVLELLPCRMLKRTRRNDQQLCGAISHPLKKTPSFCVAPSMVCSGWTMGKLTVLCSEHHARLVVLEKQTRCQKVRCVKKYRKTLETYC